MEAVDVLGKNDHLEVLLKVFDGVMPCRCLGKAGGVRGDDVVAGWVQWSCPILELLRVDGGGRSSWLLRGGCTSIAVCVSSRLLDLCEVLPTDCRLLAQTIATDGLLNLNPILGHSRVVKA